VAEFLNDAARHGLSKWTMINVLRQWHMDGTSKDDMLTAVRAARSQVTDTTRPLFVEYYDAIMRLIPEPITLPRQ
jgi:hypothetical protein